MPWGVVGSGVGWVAGVCRALCGAGGSQWLRVVCRGDLVRCGAAADGWVAWPERGARAEGRLGVGAPEREGWISQPSVLASQFAGSLETQQ